MLPCKSSNVLKFCRPLLVKSMELVENSRHRSFKVLAAKADRTQTCGVGHLKPNNFGHLRVLKYSKDSSEYRDEDESLSENEGPEGEETKENLEEIFNEISQGDPDVLKELNMIKYEIDILQSITGKVPKRIKKDDWLHLLQLKNRDKKLRFLKFLFVNEKKSENQLTKKKLVLEKRQSFIDSLKDKTGFDYKLGYNSLFMRVYSKTLLSLINERLMGAKMFSQNVIFDCSYDAYMNDMNAKNCGKQLGLCYLINSLHRSPFEIKLFNVNMKGITMKSFTNHKKVAENDSFAWEMYEESYLDMYPKEQLVYLSPHCREELHTFDRNAIYIIGAYVDKGNSLKMSLAKAKKEKLKMAKLPLDYYIRWKQGTKSLALNVVLSILLDKQLGSWETAFQNVPRRFIMNYEDETQLKKGNKFPRKKFIKM